jgi:predicted nucleic acid-binding protein
LTEVDAVADTSAFIAVERGRPLRTPIPEQLSVSCVTIGELIAGLLAAPTPLEQDRRLRTLLQASKLRPLPIDTQVAHAWAELRSALQKSSRSMDVNDSWIAATAIAHGVPVVTQDDDYVDVPGLEVVRV